MNNSIVFTGLPRSGITLLASMLNKDKDIYVTTSSPFVELLWRNYSIWSEDTYAGELDTDNMRKLKIPFLRGLTELYYSQLTSKPVVIDKRRAWQNVINIEMYRDIFGVLPKIICPVRRVVDIITSWKVLYKKNNKQWNYEDLKSNKFETAYYDLKESYAKYPECFLLVDYDNLVDDPHNVMDQVYDFIGCRCDRRILNFEVIKATELEGNHGLTGLHTLRNKLVRSDDKAEDILTEDEFMKFSDWDFWTVKELVGC
jgi:sulfotransferase